MARLGMYRKADFQKEMLHQTDYTKHELLMESDDYLFYLSSNPVSDDAAQEEKDIFAALNGLKERITIFNPRPVDDSYFGITTPEVIEICLLYTSHAGYDAEPGSLMAKLNVQGNEMMEALSKELDFPFKRIGSMVVCVHEEDIYKLEALLERGKKNGVKDLRIVDGKEAHELEPNLTEAVVAALYAPTAGIVCPFGMNIAYAENASVNGVEFKPVSYTHLNLFEIVRKFHIGFVDQHIDTIFLAGIQDPAHIVPGDGRGGRVVRVADNQQINVFI